MNDEYVNYIVGVLDELKEQFKKKNAQYGEDRDPLIISVCLKKPLLMSASIWRM